MTAADAWRAIGALERNDVQGAVRLRAAATAAGVFGKDMGQVVAQLFDDGAPRTAYGAAWLAHVAAQRR